MVLSVQEAEAFRKFTVYLENNENFKEALVSACNDNINIPLLRERDEEILIRYLFETVIGVLADTADTAYGQAVAEEREQKRLEEVKK